MFEGIDSYLKKRYKARAITTRKFVQEVEVCALAKRHPKDLILHVMTYISYSQMKMHWFDEFIKGENIRGILDKSYKDILGSKDSIFSKEFSTTGDYEAMFRYMNDSDRINSNYEESLLCEVMNNLFEYVLSKRLNLKPRTASNKEEVKKVFYYTCEELDKLNIKVGENH